MTVERPRAPEIGAPGRGAPGAFETALDLDIPDDDPWYAPTVADGIALSASAARRLAEPARTRAFVFDTPERSRAADVGDGGSIVVEDGLYRFERRR